MPDEAGFQVELTQALEKKAPYLEATSLPLLKERFRLYQTLFSNLYNILHRKSLIQEDPYQYDRKLSEVSVPSRDPFPESEKMERLSQRLAEFLAQLDFLNNYYQFSLEFLSLERLKRISGLVQWLDWGNLITASPDANTSVMAEALGRVKLGKDSISAGIVTDSVSQLASITRQLQAQLKELLSYLREAYKLELRVKLFDRLGPPLAKAAKAGPEEAMLRVQRSFRQLLGERPFYRELVREALAEEYGEEAPRLRSEALARLAVPEEKPAAQAPAVDYKALLLEAVRLLIPAEAFLQEALRKLEANRQLLSRRRRGFADRLRSLFGSSRAQADVLEIRQFDSATGATRASALNFPEFAEKVRRKAAVFQALSSSTSTAYTRLRAAAEGEIYDFLTKNLGELQLAFRTLQSLDGHFKNAASPQERGEIKGIRIELAALKNSLVRSNRKRYEYVSRKEEEKQRQKMGLS